MTDDRIEFQQAVVMKLKKEAMLRKINQNYESRVTFDDILVQVTFPCQYVIIISDIVVDCQNEKSEDRTDSRQCHVLPCLSPLGKLLINFCENISDHLYRSSPKDSKTYLFRDPTLLPP